MIAFTVLLPVWKADDPESFTEAIASLALSSRAPDFIFICQDGDLPPELSLAVSKAIQTVGARLIRNPGPLGLHHNLNHALSHVRTEWVARCDADDVNLPDRFETQAHFLESNPQVDVLGGDLIEFAPDGSQRHKLMPLDHAQISKYALWRNPINHNTVFYRTQTVLKVGGYPNLPLKEDYASGCALSPLEPRSRIFAAILSERASAQTSNSVVGA